MNSELLRQLIDGDESLTVEFKIAPPRPTEVAERLCGFANGMGGYLIFGVEDETRRLAGISNIKLAIDTILRAARLLQPQLVLDPPEPETVVLDGVKLIVATIPVNNGTLYQSGGTYWIRHGSVTTPMTNAEVEAFLYQSGRIQWELQPAPNATLEDLDLEAVREYLQHSRASESHRAGRFDDLERVLISLRCAVEVPLGVGVPYGNPLALAALRGKLNRDEMALLPTNAGILAFGKTPQRHIMQSEIICVYHKDNLGLSRWHDRKILRGNIKQLIDDAYEFVNRYVPMRAEVTGLHRKDIPAYPLEVLREAIVNAVVHRDYSLTGEFIRIFYYPDRIEIRNPGQLLPGLTLDQLSHGRAPSKLRNHALVSLLREMPGGYIEHIGSGVKYMLARMQQHGLPTPTFEQIGEFILTLYGPDSAQPAITSVIQPNNIRDISPQVVEVAAEPEALSSVALTKTQRAQQERFKLALNYLRQHGRINNLQYRTLTETSERTALRDLDKMAEMGLIRAIGETSGRYYTLP